MEVTQFELVRKVTVPFFVIPDDGSAVYIRFNSSIAPDTSQFSARVRRNRSKSNPDKPANEDPLNVAEITNLQDGQIYRLVAHAVLQSTLVEAYGESGYVGKMFRVLKSKARGKAYFTFDIDEITMKNSDAKAKK